MAKITLEFKIYGYCGAIGELDMACSKKAKTLEIAIKKIEKAIKKDVDPKFTKEVLYRFNLVNSGLNNSQDTSSNDSNSIVCSASWVSNLEDGWK